MRKSNFWEMSAVFIGIFFCVSCNKTDGKISEAEIRKALVEMQAKYRGKLKVCTGKTVFSSEGFGSEWEQKRELRNFVSFSDDSLRFRLPLEVLADLLPQKDVGDALKGIGAVDFTAGYDFLQIDSGGFVYGLNPRRLQINIGSYGLSTQKVRISFSGNYGGNYSSGTKKSMVFNVVVTDVECDGVKVENYKPSLYSFMGIEVVDSE